MSPPSPPERSTPGPPLNMRGGPLGPLRRTVIVHAPKHVEAALAEAVGLGVPIALMTARDAADYAGPAYLQAMIARGATRHPDADLQAVIDCDDAAGRVFAALDAGWKRILFTGDPAIADKLADVARQGGVELLTDRPEALDLDDEPDPRTACRAWLKLGVR